MDFDELKSRAVYKALPKKKSYRHGRDFFQGEGQEEANAKVDGWNECVDALNGAIKLLCQTNPEGIDKYQKIIELVGTSRVL